MTALPHVTPVTEPFRLFHVEVLRTRRLSPSFMRVTFTGTDLDRFADNGYDQRIKLILPLPDRGLTDLPVGPSWYVEWRQLPDDRRNPVRTYTVRAVRPEQREVDIDMVLHGETGPASRFALHAQPGDIAALLGPDAHFSGRHGGLEFAPPDDHRGPFLLAADETALPAVAGILERLPESRYGEVVVEVPTAADRLHLDAPRGVQLTWVVRDEARDEAALVAAVRAAADRIGPPPVATESEQLADPEDAPLWDVPTDEQPASGALPLYAWLAGESSAIKAMRRHLVSELGHSRRSVAFMGYWRRGHAEA